MANVNNYIRAGNASVRKAVQARKALARNKPRYDEQGVEAINAAAREKTTAMRANSKVANAGIDAVNKVKNTRIGIERDEGVRAAKGRARKAGMLAGGAAMLGIGAMSLGKEPEENEELTALNSRLSKTNEKLSGADQAIADATAKLNSFKDGGSSATDTTDSQPDTPSSSNTSQPSTPASNTSSGNNGASASPDFKQIVDMARTAGAKFPEVAAAQWALESDWGKTPSGKNNYFGIKASGNESSTSKPTWEVINGQEVNTSANFKNFDTPQDSVNELVNRWYHDYDGYKGVNRGNSANEVADLLVSENYATDPNYAAKIKDILSRQGY